MKSMDNISNRNKLIIIGASGHGNVVVDIARKTNRWQEIAFLDDNESIRSPLGIEVIGKSDDAFIYINNYDIFVAIGNNKTREEFQSRLEAVGAKMPTLLHPSAIIADEVKIGVGTVIMAGAVINCCSEIGKGCIVNTGVTIDHDNVIEDYVHISPGAHLAGTVNVGKSSWIGIGAVVCNNVKISGNCLVGAGAVVVKDITEAGTYVGVPARRVNRK